MIDIMDVVMQWVRTSWTTLSRGAPAATRRNQTPVAFPLPSSACPGVHEVLIDESQDFAPQHTFTSGLPPRTDVELTERDGTLRVLPAVAAHGKPSRRSRPPAIRLSRGEWVRWQVNYRFSAQCTCGSAWHYRMDTLNLAYGTPELHTFTGTPNRYVDERAVLR